MVFDYHLLHIRFHPFRRIEIKIYPKYNYTNGLDGEWVWQLICYFSGLILSEEGTIVHTMQDREPRWQSSLWKVDHFERADLFSRNCFADFVLASISVL